MVHIMNMMQSDMWSLFLHVEEFNMIHDGTLDGIIQQHVHDDVVLVGGSSSNSNLPKKWAGRKHSRHRADHSTYGATCELVRSFLASDTRNTVVG